MFHLLIVDDDREIQELLAVALHRPQVRIHTAATYEEGLALIESVNPPAALFDVHLSQTCRHEGLELLRQLRAHNPEARGIVITGWSSPKIMAQAYRIGATYFMRKPLDLQELEYQLRLIGLPAEAPHPTRGISFHGRTACAWEPAR